MANNEPNKSSPFEDAFFNFINSQERMLANKFGDRPLDQYIEFRDQVLTLLKSDNFRDELRRALRELTSNSDRGFERNEQIVNLLRLELEATARAADIVLAMERSKKRKSWLHKMFGRASTVNGSVKDVFDKILDGYPLLKGGIIVFGELLDIFKGD